MQAILVCAMMLSAGQAQDKNQGADVPIRSEPVRAALEGATKKKAPDITFADLERVTDLRLPHIHPQSKTLRDDDFAGLENLTQLHMYSLLHNVGKNPPPVAISGKVFAKLSKLEELRMTQDQLGNLPDDVFAGLTGLKVLDLSGTTMTRLPASMLSLPKIEVVYYAGKGMPPEDFAKLKAALGDKLKGNRQK